MTLAVAVSLSPCRRSSSRTRESRNTSWSIDSPKRIANSIIGIQPMLHEAFAVLADGLPSSAARAPAGPQAR
jgi:hypothetical protein